MCGHYLRADQIITSLCRIPAGYPKKVVPIVTTNGTSMQAPFMVTLRIQTVTNAQAVRLMQLSVRTITEVTGEKSTWVKIRLSPLEKEVFERAAKLEGMSVSTLIRTSARREATKILVAADEENPFKEPRKTKAVRKNP